MPVILLSDGSECLVDQRDLKRVSKHSWCPSRNGGSQVYAQTRFEQKTLYMHRLIMNAPKGVSVDHRNGNTLDNRRRNLRFATRSENAINSPARAGKIYSAHKGVTFDRTRNKWVAQLKADGKKIMHSRFDTEAEAVAAYQAAARQHHGEFHRP